LGVVVALLQVLVPLAFQSVGQVPSIHGRQREGHQEGREVLSRQENSNGGGGGGGSQLAAEMGLSAARGEGKPLKALCAVSTSSSRWLMMLAKLLAEVWV